MQMHSLFHDSVARWFIDRFAEPTPVQTQTWPIVAAGQHVLATAPTGSGKTLTAFLSALSQFASGDYAPGCTRVLYISPLKALNNDIQRNLFEPLKALEEDYGYPKIRVGTRSGDTRPGDRQRLLRNPPEILITTPESLSLMLTTQKGRMALGHIQTLILDEIHSLVDNRRGVQLMVNLERLADLAGEFQRIALSATVHPLESVAGYVGGTNKAGQARDVAIVNPTGTKRIDFRIRFPEAAKQAANEGQKIWDPLSDDFRRIVDDNTSTLFFTNSRRLAEKITLKINQAQAQPVAYAHHGSLAREVRNEVEHRLKVGTLKAIVATNSLEMGIDVGHLDEVVLVQSPPSVASTLQRIGRAGHQVSQTSVGTLYPTHAQDFLEAAVLAQAVKDRDIEPLKPMHAALDVLAQIIISICATHPWSIDDIYQLILRAAPYQGLSRNQFDLVVEMLSGRYEGSRVRELKPRVTLDRVKQTIQATRGAVLSLYNSGGTIPDRGYYKIRHLDTGGVLGELDEEFVWEATTGDTFTLGTQHWQIHSITHNDVVVRPAKPGNSTPPFWRSETFNRSYHFSSRIAQYLERQEAQLNTSKPGDVQAELETTLGFDNQAAIELTEFLCRQRTATQSPLPHRHHILLELVKTGPAGYHGPNNPQQLVIHTYWGGRLNQPYALALRAAWQRRYGTKPDIHADNNAIVLQCEGNIDPDEIVNLVSAERLLEFLRESLEVSGFFGARFRECAGRALLLTKQRFNQRLPLWMTRMQAKKLMSQVKQMQDFPILIETWRTCLDDEFDLPNLINCLRELRDGTIAWSFVSSTTPSPFAQHLTFNQVSRYMYADDTPEDDALSGLGEDLITDALYNDALRPRISPAIVDEFVSKRQRTYPDYGPREHDEWLEWLKERVLIPLQELAQPDRDLLSELDAAIVLQDGARAWYCHVENQKALYTTTLMPGDLPQDAPDIAESRTAWQLAREILSFYGPLKAAQITEILPSVPADLLISDEQLITGALLQGDDTQLWCDAENFEILMRMQRAQHRADFKARPAIELPTFWARLHQFGGAISEQDLLDTFERLRGHVSQINTWLNDLLAPRIDQSITAVIDEALHNFGMTWLGTGKGKITFAYPEDIALLKQPGKARITKWFADPQASYRYEQIVDQEATTSVQLNEAWWEAVWRGELTSDSIAPLLQGEARKFSLDTGNGHLSSRRRLRRPTAGWAGLWRLVPPAETMDPLTRLEADKDLVRLLLDRYGLINREIVTREGWHRGNTAWRWRDAFRALRVMELAGEVLSGQFFEQLSTPQFVTSRSLATLQTAGFYTDTFWVNATDPVAPTGLGLNWPQLPHRRASNYLAFQSGQLALVVANLGRDLTYFVSPDHAGIDAVNDVLDHLVHDGRQRVVIQTINQTAARQSPYLGALEKRFRIGQDHKSIFLEVNY